MHTRLGFCREWVLQLDVRLQETDVVHTSAIDSLIGTATSSYHADPLLSARRTKNGERMCDKQIWYDNNLTTCNFSQL
jgi:hypothetical protein